MSGERVVSINHRNVPLPPRHLRLAEMLRQNSANSELIVLTLPMPKRGHTSSALYTAWLDMMTRGLPPTLLLRGNQQSVLTFYS